MSRIGDSEIPEKLRRVRALLEEKELDGLIIGRKDNFAWLTCGRSNEVVADSEHGFALLLITRDGVRLIAQVMDGPRMIDEELPGLEAEYVPLHWYEPSREAKAAELIRGLKVLSDLPVAGAVCDGRTVRGLQWPLTGVEIDRLRRLGAETDSILRSVADELKPGMRETEIAAMLLGEYARAGARCEVLLVGSDERISRYRHPYPSEKTVQRCVLLHPAVRRDGLHANVTRLVHFGPVPEETRGRYDAACRVEAAAIALCTPGRRFSEILEAQKRVYAQCGFPEEWRHHYPGGTTGYELADPTHALDPEARVSANQAYDWFVTITGVKVEELSLNTGGRREVCSAAGRWPTAPYGYEGSVFELPQILVR